MPQLFMLPAILLFLPSQAWAIQTHGPSEGYLVHQMAHFFFSTALIFLLYVLHTRPPGATRPWKHLKISLLLFLLWNIDTTVVHWLADHLPIEPVMNSPTLFDNQLNLPTTFGGVFYYLGSLDHFLCVPAIFFLTLSLRGFCLEVESRLRQPESQGP